jgi:hypothetical protein
MVVEPSLHTSIGKLVESFERLQAMLAGLASAALSGIIGVLRSFSLLRGLSWIRENIEMFWRHVTGSSKYNVWSSMTLHGDRAIRNIESNSHAKLQKACSAVKRLSSIESASEQSTKVFNGEHLVNWEMLGCEAESEDEDLRSVGRWRGR